MVLYAGAGLPYFRAIVTVWLAHCFYQDHGTMPSPDVQPAAREAIYYAITVGWWLLQFVVSPVTLSSIAVLRGHFKRPVGTLLAFFLTGPIAVRPQLD